MKKLFPLSQPGRADARVLEAVKGDLRKYLKRERRKKIPEGFTQWDFNCRVGPDATAAAPVQVVDLIKAIDAVAAGGGNQVYVEILAAAGHRPAQPER